MNTNNGNGGQSCNSLAIVGKLLAECAKLSNTGTRFASLVYTNKEGEKSLYSMLLGVSYETVIRRTLGIVESRKLVSVPLGVDPSLAETARAEVIASLKKSLDAVLNDTVNESYTSKDAYMPLCKGAKVHLETGTIYLSGLQMNRRVLIAAPNGYKTVKSKPLTLLKKDWLNGTPSEKWRQFSLNAESVESIKIGGKELRMIS